MLLGKEAPTEDVDVRVVGSELRGSLEVVTRLLEGLRIERAILVKHVTEVGVRHPIGGVVLERAAEQGAGFGEVPVQVRRNPVAQIW